MFCYVDTTHIISGHSDLFHIWISAAVIILLLHTIIARRSQPGLVLYKNLFRQMT